MNNILKHTLILVALQLVVTLFYFFLEDLIDKEVLLFGVNVRYIITAESEELQEYFPTLYKVVWLASAFVRFGIPAIVVSFFVLKRTWQRAFISWLNGIWSKPRRISAALWVPFVATLLTSLLCYYAVTPLVSDKHGFQLWISRGFLVLCFGNLVALICANRSKVKTHLLEFLFTSPPPYSLAIFRIAFFSLMAIYVLEKEASYSGTIGKLDRQGLPGIGWLVEVIPISPELYSVACYLTLGCCVAIVVGYRTRLFLIASSALVFYVVATPNFFGKLYHNQIWIWITWIMTFSPCADVWSFDARSGRSEYHNSYNSDYGFHIRIIWLHLGIIYFFPGFYKLWVAGFDWALSDNIVNLITIEWFENYDKLPEIRIDRAPTLLKVGGLTVILFELSYIFLLQKRSLRKFAIVGGLFMHGAIGYFMYINFALPLIYMVYLPWNKILNKLKLVSFQDRLKGCPPKLKTAAVGLPALIFAANVFAGLLQINSYPFSVYPVYTDIVSDTVSYLEYRLCSPNKELIGFREEGERLGFSWEDYSRIEYRIIDQYNSNGIIDTTSIQRLWRRWRLHLEPEVDADSIGVHIATRYLSPDSSNNILNEKFLLTIPKESTNH